MSDSIDSGRVVLPDRLQRFALALCLMSLTVLGLLESSDWKKWMALAIQSELLLTGLVGWCPFYWACSLRKRVASG